jgi:DNA mismatch endonuclease (patch repair protein)
MDVFSRKTRSWIMAQIKGKHTKPEILIRRGLHALGYRFRLHVAHLPGKPDIALPKFRTVIQVRGCFWHGHRCVRGNRLPSQNHSYWREKLSRNAARDRKNDCGLRRLGWRVVVVWECRLSSPQKVESELRRIQRLLAVP